MPELQLACACLLATLALITCAGVPGLLLVRSGLAARRARLRGL